ncbi:enoyl-CoA hydratase-related protein [Streptomyces griseorubiginosus]|uniref:enoyl-CoA hydratase-related protein n=1 Tax=Streptomyces griseorubiginosus TaxID=67304 RepID=UPI001AD77BB7|nr:enoyl-CoA hydratase-related protein [Streptomyces griseorubiginosus]MBO4252328.1 enoyl-CoA hydratase [Streptomyces griseorubiginosus]
MTMANVNSSPRIRTEVRDAVGTVEISNPARHNALSVAMMTELAVALQAMDEDTRVRVVVLRGAGERAFVSGADISEFPGRGDGAARQAADEAATTLFAQLSALSVPVIARIHGYCLGAGMALALGSDLRYADTSGVLAIPAARLGVGYPLEQTAALVQTVGPAAASDLLFTGRRLPAAEAYAMGLVDRVVEPDELGKVVDELAATIAANAPLSIRAAKASIRAVRRLSEGDVAAGTAALDLAHEAVARCGTSNDLREGALAFLDKRLPHFTGS